MNDYIVQENSYLNIMGLDYETINDLITIGVQIKENLGLMASPIQFVSGSRVYIGSIIGNLSINQTRLIITPKIASETALGVRDVKTLYDRTLRCSIGNMASTIYFAKNSVTDDNDIFSDILANFFITSLNSALRGSKILQYEERIEKTSVIKGKILVGKQLSQPATDEKTWCKYKRMSDNNIYNQLLFWACRYLSESVHNFDLKRRLLVLSKEFVQSTSLLSVFSVKNLRMTRQFAEYIEVLALAKDLYLGVNGKKENGVTGNQICGYAINMERAFENIVCTYAQKASVKLGVVHKGQASIRFATTNGAYDYEYDIRPDDLISNNQNYLVMDAKYKVLSSDNKYKRKPVREDFYQMISSCIAYNSSEAILVYPLSSNFPTQAWETVQTVNGKKIIVRTIGIDILGEESAIVQTLETAIRESYIYQENAV